MDTMIAEIRDQHFSTLAMWEGVVDACSDIPWSLPDGCSPFWREAYHSVFWQRNCFSGAGCRLELRPFGQDIDPRLFTPIGVTVGKDEMRSFGRQTREHIETVSQRLSVAELAVVDEFEPGESTTALHRILYGLRHTQHHVGKLTQSLASAGVVVENWQ
jgi:hypothetical protein